MSRFESDLVLRCLPGIPIADLPYQLQEEFVYRTDELPDRNFIIVPAGYRTDFASIPRLLWRILPPGGRYREAAVVHDWLCDVDPKICNHIQAAKVFDEAMEELGVKPWKRRLITWAVCKFGPKFKAGE